MLKMILPVLFFIAFVEGGFFDLTDVEDPLALLWNLPHVHKQFSKCIIDDIHDGVCMENAKCVLTGGTPHGKCGIMYTCCSHEQSCKKTSDQKQSYFQITNLNSAITDCRYTIKLRNKNVCQVRLDFEELILASPQESNNFYKCSTDALTINPHYYGVPELCGYNTNQHLYIHVNQSTDTNNAINIDIHLASRLTQPDLTKPAWKIKFTQLECPTKRNKFDIFKFKDFDDIVNDFNILAPQGAIQYFTESKGEIRSFGFNPADKSAYYPFPEHYTIAFKRPSSVCGIRFTPQVLNIFENADGKSCSHYLFIPEFSEDTSQGTNNLVEVNSQVCYAKDIQFSSFPPGPLYINFKAVASAESPTIQTDENPGFQINYELLYTC